MLCKAQPMPSCGVCVSVYLSVTFVNSVEMNKPIFNLFSASGSHVILVCPYQTLWRYSDWDPLTRASSAGVIAILSHYLAPSRAVNGSTANCNTHSCDHATLCSIVNRGRNNKHPGRSGSFLPRGAWGHPHITSSIYMPFWTPIPPSSSNVIRLQPPPPR